MAPPVVKSELIVQTLLSYLALIGVGPSEWNTAPIPPVEGAPGDSIEDVPHQVYLEYVNTLVQEGDGLSIPVGEQNHRMNFTVWIFAKEVGDGMRQLRYLEDDVRRALHAAEAEIIALTGFSPGPITNTNREGLFPAGFRSAGFDFYCDYVWEATPLALDPDLIDLHALMRSTAFTYNPGTAEWEQWLVSAGSTVIIRGCHLFYDTGVGVNKVRWHKEEPPRHLYRDDGWYPEFGAQEQHFRIPHAISTWLAPMSPIVAPDATTFIGIGLGTPDNNPAYPFVEDFPVEPCIQLRLRLSDYTWHLFVAPGGSAAATVVPLASVPTPVLGHGNHVKLERDPLSRVIRAWVDGLLGIDFRDETYLPPYTPTSPVAAHCGPNYFVTSGAGATSRTRALIGPLLVTRPGYLNLPVTLPA